MRFFLVLLIACAWEAVAQKRVDITWSLDWHPTEAIFAVGGDDSLLKIYSVPELSMKASFPMHSVIRCLQWSPDGNTLALSTATGIFLFDKESKKIKQIPGSPASRALDWKPTGDQLAIADFFGKVSIWTRDGQLLHAIQKQTDGKDDTRSFLSIDWHPTKDIVVTGGDEIRLFETNGKELKVIKHRPEYTGVLTVQWHPSGEFFASGDYGHHGEGVESIIQFWNADGTLIKTLNGSFSEYRNIRWNKSGTRLASASDALRLWSEDGSLLFTGNSNTIETLWGIGWQNNELLTSSSSGVISWWGENEELLRSSK